MLNPTRPHRRRAAVAAVPGSPAPAGRPRLVALDALRIVAALLVVFHHYVGYGGGPSGSESAWTKPAWVVFPTAERLAAYTWTGVELFFVISGFVICMSSWAAASATSSSPGWRGSTPPTGSPCCSPPRC